MSNEVNSFWDSSDNLFEEQGNNPIESDLTEKDNKDKVEEEADDLFSMSTENDKPEVKTEEIKTAKEDLLVKMANIVGYEDEELEGIETPEDLIESVIKNRLSEKLDNLPDDAQYAIKYILEGGDIIKALQQISNKSYNGISLNEDMEDSLNSERVLRLLLEKEGLDGDSINIQVDLLKQSKKLEEFSKSKYSIHKGILEKEKEAIMLKNQQYKEEEEKELQNDKESIKNLIKDDFKIGDIVIPKSIKKDLPSYIMDRTVKTQGGGYMSELQKDLFYELPKNKTAMIQLASLMKNRNKDGSFNLEFLKKEIENNMTKSINRDLSRNNSNNVELKEANSVKYLADLFS
jgi:hypothetical protein